MIRDLRELASLTSDSRGAQRVSWTEPWDRARRWLSDKIEEIDPELEIHRDGADNLWVDLPGAMAGRWVTVGSHLDSVPDGGWLDGCLGVVAGLELFRAAAKEALPGCGIRLIDWSDEEGRFGSSLLGSMAATGGLDPDRVDSLTDRLGISLAELRAERGLEFAPGTGPGPLTGVVAGFELHIEQGPVLEDLGLPLGVPSGSVAIERSRIVFEGVAAHAGTAPFRLRRDAGLAAARSAISAREAAIESGGLATTGFLSMEPGVPTAVPSTAVLSLDLRHESDRSLADMAAEIQRRIREIAGDEGVRVRFEPVWSFPAVAFDPELIAIARETVTDSPDIYSGALHDSVAVAHSGVPTAMIFVRSVDGVSHSPLEDSSEEDLALGLAALAGSVLRAADR